MAACLEAKEKKSNLEERFIIRNGFQSFYEAEAAKP